MRLALKEAHVDSARPDHSAQRDRETPEEQKQFIELFQAELQSAEEPLVLVVDVNRPSRLQAEVHRHGKAVAVLWRALPQDGDPYLVAMSVLLTGRDGADDVAAVESLKKHGPNLNAAGYNMMLASERPVVCVLYFDNEWFQNSRIALTAMGLSVAHLAERGQSPSLKFDVPLTPEEEAEQRASIDRIMKVFAIIQEDWVTRRKLLYNVRAQEKITGKPIQEIIGVKFWAGVDGKGGAVLGIHELAALFLMLGDYSQQTPGMKYMVKPQTNHTVRLRYEPAELASIIRQIKISEPKN